MTKIIPRIEIMNVIGRTIPEKSPLGWRPRSELIVLLKMTLLQQRSLI